MITFLTNLLVGHMLAGYLHSVILGFSWPKKRLRCKHPDDQTCLVSWTEGSKGGFWLPDCNHYRCSHAAPVPKMYLPSSARLRGRPRLGKALRPTPLPGRWCLLDHVPWAFVAKVTRSSSPVVPFQGASAPDAGLFAFTTIQASLAHDLLSMSSKDSKDLGDWATTVVARRRRNV